MSQSPVTCHLHETISGTSFACVVGFTLAMSETWGILRTLLYVPVPALRPRTAMALKQFHMYMGV